MAVAKQKYKKVGLSIFLGASCFLSTQFSYGAGDPAIEAGLVPHKALYEISLSARKSSAKVLNVKGKMSYEWQPSCDAWMSTHKFDVMYEYVEAPSVRMTSEFSTYESFDGKEFSYTSQRKQEEHVFQEIRGNVQANGTDYPNEAIFSIPEDLVYNLPKGTLFPTAHSIHLMKKVKAGKKFDNAIMFDGSDADGPIEINTFIGQPSVFTPDDSYKDHIDPEMISAPARKMRSAFFVLSTPQETADYEMSMIFHDNGVISDMEVEYGDFSIVQRLVAIEKLDGTCDNKDEAVGE